MSGTILMQIACPECRQPIDIREHEHQVTCAVCGGHFTLPGRLCHHCGNYHVERTVICRECGAALGRICNTCHSSNWAGDEHCFKCGTPMDVTDILRRHLPGSTSSRLNEQMAFSRQVKEEEEAASQRRMAELMAIEEARQAEFLARRRKQKQQDRLLLVGGMIVTAVLLLALAVYLVLV
jgi:uncharacterized protein YbaR (Trm112 family)